MIDRSASIWLYDISFLGNATSKKKGETNFEQRKKKKEKKNK